MLAFDTQASPPTHLGLQPTKSVYEITARKDMGKFTKTNVETWNKNTQNIRQKFLLQHSVFRCWYPFQMNAVYT